MFGYNPLGFGSGSQVVADTLQFHAPLTSSLTLDTGAYTPTFTRATTATVVDFEGLVKTVLSGESRHQGARRVENLFAYSEDFSNAAWTKITASISGEQITATGANAVVRQGYDVGGEQHVLSVWLRRISGSGDIQINADWGGGWTTVTLTGTYQRFSVQTAGSPSGGTAQAGIKIITNGDVIEAKQIQCEKVEGQANQNPSEYVSADVESTPYHGANVDGVQYFETENGNTVASNVVTEATGSAIAEATLKGYLNEEQRTNIGLYSEDLTNVSKWFGIGAVVTADQTAAPDGNTTADKITDDNSTGTGTVRVRHGAFTVASATDTCYSCFLKKDQLDWAVLSTLGFDASANGDSYFDLTNGVVGTKSANHSASGIEDYGDGWFRCWVVFNSTTDVAGFLNIYVAEADTDNVVDKDGTSSIYAWGTQLEEGTFPTSYIPTTTTAVTRNADVLTYDYQPPALVGSCLATHTLIGSIGASTRYLLGSNTNCRWMYYLSNLTLKSYDGSAALTYSAGTIVDTETKFGLTWEDGASPERNSYKDGSLGNTSTLDTDGYNASTNPLGIGNRGDSATQFINAAIRDVKFYTDAKDQAFMEAATT